MVIDVVTSQRKVGLVSLYSMCSVVFLQLPSNIPKTSTLGQAGKSKVPKAGSLDDGLSTYLHVWPAPQNSYQCHSVKKMLSAASVRMAIFTYPTYAIHIYIVPYRMWHLHGAFHQKAYMLTGKKVICFKKGKLTVVIIFHQSKTNRVSRITESGANALMWPQFEFYSGLAVEQKGKNTFMKAWPRLGMSSSNLISDCPHCS